MEKLFDWTTSVLFDLPFRTLSPSARVRHKGLTKAVHIPPQVNFRLKSRIESSLVMLSQVLLSRPFVKQAGIQLHRQAPVRTIMASSRYLTMIKTGPPASFRRDMVCPLFAPAHVDVQHFHQTLPPGVSFSSFGIIPTGPTYLNPSFFRNMSTHAGAAGAPQPETEDSTATSTLGPSNNKKRKKKSSKKSNPTPAAAALNYSSTRKTKSGSSPLPGTMMHQRELETALEKGGERVLRVRDFDEEIPKLPHRVLGMFKNMPRQLMRASSSVFQALYILVTDPPRALTWSKSMLAHIKTEIKHYWLGTKLLYADVTTSTRIMRRVLSGNSLSRRERKQLQRTVVDVLRLVPFSFFIIIPFMELLLPVALKIFPSMLPSTYQDSFQKEENMKKQLQLRLSLAEFLQNTVKDVVEKTRENSTSEETVSTAEEVLDFIERVQSGDTLKSHEILKFASLFNDELMLDNISRPQLVGMCRFMGMQPYGNDNFLRFQLRNKIRQLKSDDQDIIWEGIEVLTKEELQVACGDRGMRNTGLTKAGYRRQLKQWLDLSVNKNVPASLLIMSRALNITASERPEVALAASMSSMDEEVVTEVALEASAALNTESPDMKALKLESIRYQNELIEEEEKDREETKKKVNEVDQKLITESVMMEPELEETPDLAASSTSTVQQQQQQPPPIDTMLEKPARELSLEELSALESLAFRSSVEKERKAFQNMTNLKSEMSVQMLLAAGRIGNQSKENKAAMRMMKKIDSMISRLGSELEDVDRMIGDRLNFLDKDRDGVLSAEELKTAIQNILRDDHSEEQAEYAVSQIDENKDGKVTVAELVNWIEKRTSLVELTGNSSKSSSSSSSSSSSHEEETSSSTSGSSTTK